MTIKAFATVPPTACNLPPGLSPLCGEVRRFNLSYCGITVFVASQKNIPKHSEHTQDELSCSAQSSVSCTYCGSVVIFVGFSLFVLMNRIPICVDLLQSNYSLFCILPQHITNSVE